MRKGPNPAVKLGRDGYKNSLERNDNPYNRDKHPTDHRAWDKGWMKERRENER